MLRRPGAAGARGAGVMGEGDVRDRGGQRVAAAEALRASGAGAGVLAEKEGLALINGTDGMLGMLLLALRRRPGPAADWWTSRPPCRSRPCAGPIRSSSPSSTPFAPTPARRLSAANLSGPVGRLAVIVSSHLDDTPRCRTRTRCAARRRCTARRATPSASPRRVADVELASGIDNPSVLADGTPRLQRKLPRRPARLRARLPGDRRRRRRLDVRAPHRPAAGPARSFGLPPFLAAQAGVDSGLMIAQYTQAALVSEMKRLAAPASVDSIPTSAHAGGPRLDGLARRAQAPQVVDACAA